MENNIDRRKKLLTLLLALMLYVAMMACSDKKERVTVPKNPDQEVTLTPEDTSLLRPFDLHEVLGIADNEMFTPNESFLEEEESVAMD